MNTPARFLWNLPHSFSVLKVLTSPFLITDVMQYRSRLFDLDGIGHVKEIWANSQAVAERIATFYGKTAKVLYPPSIPDSLLKTDFEQDILQLREELGDFVMYMGRVESFKNLDLLIDTYEQRLLPENFKSVIVGSGPYLKTIRRRLTKIFGSPLNRVFKYKNIAVEQYGDVIVTDYIDEQHKLAIAAASRGFLSLNDEDFGITKAEALAVGTPLIAWKAGAAKEVVTEGVNGVLFDKPEPLELAGAIQRTLATEFHRPMIRHSAKPYTVTAFHANLDKLLYA